mgnify:CR=1 FL=1
MGQVYIQMYMIATIGCDKAFFSSRDVAGFEIAVDDASLVRGFECCGDLSSDAQHLVQRQRAFRTGAFDQFHDDVVGTDVVNLADVESLLGR